MYSLSVPFAMATMDLFIEYSFPAIPAKGAPAMLAHAHTHSLAHTPTYTAHTQAQTHATSSGGQTTHTIATSAISR